MTPFHAKYFAYELTKRSSSDSIEKLASSLLDAQVDLNPHQVEAALFAFRSPLFNGAILADEVGLGKTIEACLVISQKRLNEKIKFSLLFLPIFVNSGYRNYWINFLLSVVILETKSFNEEI